MNMKSRTYKLSDRLPFGKYKGQTLRSVIEQAPDYIGWCCRKVEGFRLGEDAEALFASLSGAKVGSTSCGADGVAVKPEPEASASSPSSGGLEILACSSRMRDSYWKKAVGLADDAEIISDPAYLQGRKAIELVVQDFEAASARGVQLEIPF